MRFAGDRLLIPLQQVGKVLQSAQTYKETSHVEKAIAQDLNASP